MDNDGTKKKQLHGTIALLICAFIWGTAFVAQTTGGDEVGPYTFNCVRSFIGAGAVTIVIAFMDKKSGYRAKKLPKASRKQLLVGGLLCGIALGSASLFQQMGLFYGTGAGKAGFLTACYIILVPIVSMFFGKKARWNVWAAVGLALIGLYLLCLMGNDLTMRFSDILILISSLLYTVQILFIDHYAPRVHVVRLARLQFLVAGFISALPMLFLEIGKDPLSWAESFCSLDAWIAILFAGVMSSGIAYTLQMVGQRDLNPTVASILMSLESVFAVIAGAVLLKERMAPHEAMGCILMFAAVILAQITFGRKKVKCETA